jgi:hypothetical protein
MKKLLELCMVWLIIVLFILIGLFPPVYRPVRGVRVGDVTLTSGGQNSFAFLFNIPKGYRVNYRTLFIEWAIATAIPAGVIISLRIKNRPS